MQFSDLGLSPQLIKALEEKSYSEPTPIQAKAIPEVLKGHDVMAAAQTGTGKTAGFTLPILELLQKGRIAKSNSVRALILTPTRELAAQVGENVAWYRKYTDLSSNMVFGGVKINPQMKRLCKGSDVLIATPGRLLDLFQQNAIHFDQLEIFVLDEADRMLDMGFIRDIHKIIKLLPQKRQNLLFSATFSEEIKELAKTVVTDAVEISVSPENQTAVSVEESIYPVDKDKKSQLLIHLIHEKRMHHVLVFCRTKHGANKLTRKLDKADISAMAIHGDKSQGARTKALANFKAEKIQVLVATDIAARGIDIKELPFVVNFDLPHVSEDYVHRIGRTGRAGQDGVALSLVSIDEFKQLRDIQRLTKQVLTRHIVEGFEPSEQLPELKLDTRPFKAKKPKKNMNKALSNNAKKRSIKNNKASNPWKK